MPRSPAPADFSTTPTARLVEGDLRSVLGYLFAQASVGTTDVFRQRVGDPMDLRPVEYTILALVAHNPGVTANQLSRALSVTPPNIKIWVDRLEARALVERRSSEQDRRTLQLQATGAGHALSQRATAALVEGETALLQALTAGERTILAELLHKVARARAQPSRSKEREGAA